MIAVLTGDIVFSSSTKNSQGLVEILKDLFRDIEAKFEVLGSGAEIHRGDGFQLALAQPQQSLKVALLLRTGLMKAPAFTKPLDTRIAIGIGDYNYLNNSVNESSGAVFERSGHGLDALKKESTRLSLTSPSDDFNDEMSISLTLADTLIKSWSKADAEIAWYSWFYDINQAEIARKLGISQPAVSKRKARAHITELELLMARFSQKITRVITYG
jgi:hypothetical protein